MRRRLASQASGGRNIPKSRDNKEVECENRKPRYWVSSTSSGYPRGSEQEYLKVVTEILDTVKAVNETEAGNPPPRQ